MITGELKSKVDSIWNTMWSGGISNPLSVIEQLSYLLFIKRLDELHTLKEAKAARTGKPIEDPIFTAKQDKLRWSRFKEAAPEPMFETMRDGVFPFIKSLGQKGGADGEGGSTYSHHMKDALFMMPTARVLANVVDQLDGIDMADSDTKGDLYEYMLGKIATAGQNGQFRTPRHIIGLMVDMTAPPPKDVICDPACGTAGFLVAASEHLVEHHSDAIYKDAAAPPPLQRGAFHGYDFDNTMLRIGSMNMLLHGVENPDIRYKDSLAQTDDDNAEKYSLDRSPRRVECTKALLPHCHLGEGSALLPREIFRSGSFSAGARHRIPFNECAGAEQAVVRRPQEVSTDSEERLHDPVHRRESLALSGRREPPHLALPRSCRVVGDLRASVRVLISDVDHRRHHGAAPPGSDGRHPAWFAVGLCCSGARGLRTALGPVLVRCMSFALSLTTRTHMARSSAAGRPR